MGRAFAGSGRFARAFKLPLLFHFSSVLLLSEGTMIDTWIDASPISAPVSHPTAPTTSRARRMISAKQRDEATNARRCSNMHFPANCKSDPCVSLARRRAFTSARSVPADELFFFVFNVNHDGCEFVSVWRIRGYKFDMEVRRVTNCELAGKEKKIISSKWERIIRGIISFVI